MGLAVAGLKEEEIKNRTRKLAEGDWSDFSPAERTAFPFAVQLTRAPASVGVKEIQTLRETFGEHRALDVVFYVSWANYMTRVADAFQLPLEEGNPFAPPKDTPSKETPPKTPGKEAPK